MASDVRSDGAGAGAGAEMRGLGEYDALADLFLSHDHAKAMLGGPKPAAMPRASEGGPALRFPREDVAPVANGLIDVAPPEAATSPLMIEGLILGHLPVLGAAWVGQYAKHIAASTHEPVALLRMQEGQVSLDLVSPVGATARAHSRVGAASMDPGTITLEAAIAQARREASRWLIRVDEVHETELLGVEGLAQVTLLTGADDAAVVSSYRTLKQLSRQLNSQAAQRDADEAMTLGLAILGADEARASAAEAKLREGARTFLSTPIAPAAKVGKISPGTTTTLYRAPAGQMSASETLAAALGMLRDGHRTIAQDETSVGVSPVRLCGANETATLHAMPPAREAISAGPTSGVRTHTETAASIARGAADDLASLAGLVPADVTCPYAAAVQLAWGEGGLHLLAMQEDCKDPVRELLAAAAWAHDHKALLARLGPGGVARSAEGAGGFGPTLHLVTRDLRSARSLLETAIRVHVLVEVKTGAGVVRALAPAN